MRSPVLFPFLLLTVSVVSAATFGTVVSRPGGAAYSDIALDQARSRLYLVNPAANTIDVYSIAQKAFLSSISVPGQPEEEAMSRSGSYLYVTAYTSSVLYQINLTTLAVSTKISIPYHPEGVGVGADERVLITTVGSGTTTNTLFLYNPSASGGNNLTSIGLTLPPAVTTSSTTVGRETLSYSSALIATADGKYLIGVNGISSSERAIFVYETASATVLRSREVVNLSNVLSIAPDGSRFMAGSTLFDFNTLQVIAQENVANSPFEFPTGTTSNFNMQANQGGSVFSPDGATLYAAFNVNPVASPAVAANVTELLLNDPTNLLIRTGFEMPENLAGKMVITAAGDTAYGISDSGFIILPVGAVSQSPLVAVDNSTVFLASDQCGASAGSSTVNVSNAGAGRLTVNVQSYTLSSSTGVSGVGGTTGAGGTTITPPTGGGGPGIPGGTTGPTAPTGAPAATGGTATAGATTTTTSSTGPTFTLSPNSNGGVALTFIFNPNASKSGYGTNGESDFLVQSPEAINIPPNVRVFQNYRNAEARGAVYPVARNISGGEALMDLLFDSTRQRVYLSNSGLNRIEIFDIAHQQFLTPISVGQLPHNIAFGADTNTLYVANSGGESISIVDLTKGAVVDTVQFPALPYDSSSVIITPQAMASTVRGPLVLMSDGTLYSISGNQAIRRSLNTTVFGSGTTTISSGSGTYAFRTMASSSDGLYTVIFTGTGNVYLYSALIDDFTIGKQIFTTLSGFLGPVAAGPNGAYYVVDGVVLNSSLTPIVNIPAGTSTTGTTTSATSSRPIAAVAAVSATSYSVFTQPIKSSSSTAATDGGIIQLLNSSSGQQTVSAPALENAPSAVTGTSRVVTNGRTLAIDSTGNNAYAITASGLSVIPLSTIPASARPVVASNGVVNLANYRTAVAAGGLAGVFGSNLAASAVPGTSKLPYILGGTCVTLNNAALPLLATAAGQINFQLPPSLAAGKFPLVVRSISNQAASTQSVNVTVAKYAPAVFVSTSGQAAIYHSDGSPVTTSNPTTRDQRLTIYATGLGATTGGTVTAGSPSPSSPLAVTGPLTVYFGTPGYSQAPVIVEWSGLAPGLIGVYQVDVYVPGTHMEGDALPVVLQIGGVMSPTTGTMVPTVSSH
jgi:uncharacterized protein (TIGR03437 family)